MFSIRSTKSKMADGTKKLEADAPHCLSGGVLSCPYYRKQEVIPTPSITATSSSKSTAKAATNGITLPMKTCDPPGYVLKRSETMQREAIQQKKEDEKRRIVELQQKRQAMEAHRMELLKKASSAPPTLLSNSGALTTMLTSNDENSLLSEYGLSLDDIEYLDRLSHASGSGGDEDAFGFRFTTSNYNTLYDKFLGTASSRCSGLTSATSSGIESV